MTLLRVRLTLYKITNVGYKSEKLPSDSELRGILLFDYKKLK